MSVAATTKGRGLHVLFVQPNSEVGGSDVALARTVESLVPRGVKSTVVLPGEGPLVPRLRAAGADVHFVPMRQLRTLPSPLYQAGYLLGLVPTVRAVAQVISAVQPHVVHSNSLYCLYGAFAARYCRVPHLWHLREIPPQVPLLTQSYARMVAATSQCVLAMTDACADGLFGRSRPRHCTVLPDALDADAFAAGADGSRVRRELGIASDTPVVGFVARLDPWKGADIFLEACRLVAQQRPEAHFILAGGAPAGFEGYAETLHRLARDGGIAEQTHFLGWRYSLSEIASVLDGFDVFCHTSILPEPFGLVLLEAMAVGTPVIASAAGGPLTIVRDGETGLLTPPGDHKRLSAAILGLLRDPARRARLGAAGAAHVRSAFSVPMFAASLTALYGEMISASEGSSSVDRKRDMR